MKKGIRGRRHQVIHLHVSCFYHYHSIPKFSMYQELDSQNTVQFVWVARTFFPYPWQRFQCLKGAVPLTAVPFKQNSLTSKNPQHLSWLLYRCLRCSLFEAVSIGKSGSASVPRSPPPLWILSQNASLSQLIPTEIGWFPKEISPLTCPPSMHNLTFLLLSVTGFFFPAAGEFSFMFSPLNR